MSYLTGKHIKIQLFINDFQFNELKDHDLVQFYIPDAEDRLRFSENGQLDWLEDDSLIIEKKYIRTYLHTCFMPDKEKNVEQYLSKQYILLITDILQHHVGSNGDMIYKDLDKFYKNDPLHKKMEIHHVEKAE